MEGAGLDRANCCLESLVRIGAVQDGTPAQSLAFLFRLKPILREQLDGEASRAMEDRIDSLALLAFDLFTRAREEARRLQADEVRRQSYVQRRAGGQEA
jgi:hypothetical protein